MSDKQREAKENEGPRQQSPSRTERDRERGTEKRPGDRDTRKKKDRKDPSG